jgi:hypothetical protein
MRIARLGYADCPDTGRAIVQATAKARTALTRGLKGTSPEAEGGML